MDYKLNQQLIKDLKEGKIAVWVEYQKIKA